MDFRNPQEIYIHLLFTLLQNLFSFAIEEYPMKMQLFLDRDPRSRRIENLGMLIRQWFLGLTGNLVQ